MSTATDVIAGFESCRLKAYQDQGGVWTIGYGCTGPGIGPGTTWTQDQADTELAGRVARVQHVLQAMCPAPRSDNETAALCSLAYNIGLTAFERSTVRRELNVGHLIAAADAFLLWNKVDGQVNQGLVNRRKAERALFLSDSGLS